MGHAHLALGRAAACELDDVVAVTGADGPHDVADGSRIAGLFKGVQHHEGAEPSEVPAVVLDARIVAATAGAGDAGEVLSAGDALLQGEGLVPSRQGVVRGGFGGHADQQVGGADLLEGAVVGLANHGVEQIVVDEVGAGELLAVAGQLAHERSGGVHAEVLGGLHLELEVDEQIHVLIEALGRDEAVAVVLLENVGEVRRAHRVAGHGHHGLGGGPGQGETQEEKQTRQAGQDRGGGAVVAHRGELTAEFSASPSILTFSCAEESHRT